MLQQHLIEIPAHFSSLWLVQQLLMLACGLSSFKLLEIELLLPHQIILVDVVLLLIVWLLQNLHLRPAVLRSHHQWLLAIRYTLAVLLYRLVYRVDLALT